MTVFNMATSLTSRTLALLGGLGMVAVQQQGPVRIDADQLAADIELTAEQQRQVTPEVERLNELFVAADQLEYDSADPQQRREIWNGFADVTSRIAAVLTPAQWNSFEYILDGAWSQSQGFTRGRGMHSGMGYGRGMDYDRGMSAAAWWPGCDCRGEGMGSMHGARRSGSQGWYGCRH